MTYAGPNSARRFLVHCRDYVEAVAREAELRETDDVLDTDAFRDLRRENSAIRLCFGLFEFALGIDLPDQIFEDTNFMDMYWAAADMVCWSNVRHQIYRPSIRALTVGSDPRTCTPTIWSRLKATTGTTLLPSS